MIKRLFAILIISITNTALAPIFFGLVGLIILKFVPSEIGLGFLSILSFSFIPIMLIAIFISSVIIHKGFLEDKSIKGMFFTFFSVTVIVFSLIYFLFVRN